MYVSKNHKCMRLEKNRKKPNEKTHTYTNTMTDCVLNTGEMKKPKKRELDCKRNERRKRKMKEETK